MDKAVAPVVGEAMLQDIEYYCTPELFSNLDPQAVRNLIASHRTLQAHRATATARVKWLEEGVRKFGMNDLFVNDVEAGEYADWLAAEPMSDK